MRKRLSSLISSSLLVILLLNGCATKQVDNKDNKTKEYLQEYIKAAYSPKTIEEVREAYNSSTGTIFTDAMAHYFFSGADKQELTDRDLARSISVQISHGNAEYQSDNIERYLADISLYDNITKELIGIRIIFKVDSEGMVYTFNII